MFGVLNGLEAILVSLTVFIIVSIIVVLFATRDQSHKNTTKCTSCKHLKQYAMYSPHVKMCWNKRSVFHFLAADINFWRKQSVCEFYEEKSRSV